MKNPYCDSLEYDETKREHVLLSDHKKYRHAAKRKEGNATVKYQLAILPTPKRLFSDRINHLIAIGKVKVYNSLTDFRNRNK